MADSNVFKHELSDDDVVKRDIFLRFHYADVKDAFKQLFTIIAAVFAFSAAFVQKAGAAENVEWYWKVYYFSPYALFSLSLGICLVGYYMLGVAGDKATNIRLWDYWIPSWNKMEFTQCALRSSTALELSGGMFLVGLLMLAVVAAF